MAISTSRRLIGLCALAVVACTAYASWELWWSLAGLGAFAVELSTPRPDGPLAMSPSEVESKLEGFAVARLNRLAVFTPVSGACLATALGILVAATRSSRSKEAPQ